MTRLRALLASLSVVILWTAGQARGQDAPEQRAPSIVAPSVVYIETDWSAYVRVPKPSQLNFFNWTNEGNAFTWTIRCSGFIVSPDGYIVTAGHCVDPGAEGARGQAIEIATAWLIDQGHAFAEDFDFWVQEGHLTWRVEGEESGSQPDRTVRAERGVSVSGLESGQPLATRLVDYKPLSEGDVALLKVEESGLPSLEIAPSEGIDVGDSLLSVGFPGASDEVTDATYDATFKQGTVSAKKTREGGELPVFEISADVSGGMSGGPTVDASGRVIGVNSFGIASAPEFSKFISPSSLIQEMLSRNAVPTQLGPIDIAYRAGIDAYFAGNYTEAVKKFDEVLELDPAHQSAQEFKAKAREGAASAPKAAPEPAPEGGLSILLIVGIGAAVVLLGGGAFLLTRRRKAGLASVPESAAPAGVSPSATVGFQRPAAGPMVTPPPAAPAPAGPSAEPAEPSVPRAETGRFCENCGASRKEGARFCENCGQPFS